MTARCGLTELYVDQCAHCLGITTETERAAVDPVADFLNSPPVTLGPWITAAYPGECECGGSFDEGEQIRADGEGGWLAECCGHVDG